MARWSLSALIVLILTRSIFDVLLRAEKSHLLPIFLVLIIMFAVGKLIVAAFRRRYFRARASDRPVRASRLDSDREQGSPGT
jgi:hypothetical protein